MQSYRRKQYEQIHLTCYKQPYAEEPKPLNKSTIHRFIHNDYFISTYKGSQQKGKNLLIAVGLKHKSLKNKADSNTGAPGSG